MIGTRFEMNHREYKVWGEYGIDQITGEQWWMCREYYGDGTIYLTTWDINEALKKPTDRQARIRAQREV